MNKIKIPMRTESSKQGLRNLCNYLNIENTKKMTIVEIGSYRGDSTIIFANVFKKVITIDPFKSGIGGINNSVDMRIVFKQFLNNIKDYDNIEYIKDFSYNVVNQFKDGSLDIVYIDGLHTPDAVKKDIQDWLPKIKKGGYIAGHDFHRKKFPGVVLAVTEMIGSKVKLFKDSSWIKQI
jgi:predicted O-methyltransferase YrrM